MDLGTANTIIISDDKIVVDEPSVVSLDRRTDKMIAVGGKAKMMYEKEPKGIRTIRPLRDGVIADFSACEQMMRGLIKMVHSGSRLFSPSLRMVIGVPSGSTEVELRAVRDSAEHAGGRDVYLIYEPMAAAIGIGIDVEAPEGNMIVDIGGGSTEIAVISLGGIVSNNSIRVAGDDLTTDIREYMSRQHNVKVSERMAERIKIHVGSALTDLGEEAPVFKILTDKQREVINRILDLMDKDVYGEGNDQVMPEMFIDMSWLDKTVTDWCRDQNKLVLRSGSRAHNTFYKRSSVSAFRIATLCAYLYGLECGTKELPNGLKRRVKRIYLFAAQYILDQMLGKWGKKYNDLMQNRVAGDSNVRLPVFDQLSGTFTTDQLKELLTRNELTTSAKVFLSKWKAKGWIMKVSKDVYKKNEKDDSTM